MVLDGQVCLQVFDGHTCYLFDMLQPNEDVLRYLKAILEVRSVSKVMHDCRQDSAALYYQFGIKLRNVMDTQVGSWPALHMFHCSTCPHRYPAYPACKAQALLGVLCHMTCNNQQLSGMTTISAWMYRAGGLWLDWFLGQHAGSSTSNSAPIQPGKAVAKVQFSPTHHQRR